MSKLVKFVIGSYNIFRSLEYKNTLIVSFRHLLSRWCSRLLTPACTCKTYRYRYH